MRTHSRIIVLSAAVALALTSCSTEPKRLNGRHRQPINAAVAPAPAAAPVDANVEAPAVAAAAESDQMTASVVTLPPSFPPAAARRVFRMYFNTGRSEFRVPADMQAELLALSQTASRILVKGRTDGQAYSAVDEQVALNRALRARQFLIKHGVEPTRIDIQFASAADYLAENTSAEGRSKNRRVEIELELTPAQVAKL